MKLGRGGYLPTDTYCVSSNHTGHTGHTGRRILTRRRAGPDMHKSARNSRRTAADLDRAVRGIEVVVGAGVRKQGDLNRVSGL